MITLHDDTQHLGARHLGPQHLGAQQLDTRWSYTAGRSRRARPELVVLGLEVGVARGVLRLVHQRWEQLQLDVPFQLGEGWFVLRPVPRAWLAHDPRRMTNWWHRWGADGRIGRGRPPEVVQVVWGDAHGRFPDDPRCDPMVSEGQPVLALDPFSVPQVPQLPQVTEPVLLARSA